MDTLRVSSNGNTAGLRKLCDDYNATYTVVFEDSHTLVLDVSINRWPAFFVFKSLGFNPLVLNY